MVLLLLDDYIFSSDQKDRKQKLEYIPLLNTETVKFMLDLVRCNRLCLMQLKQKKGLSKTKALR